MATSKPMMNTLGYSLSTNFTQVRSESLRTKLKHLVEGVDISPQRGTPHENALSALWKLSAKQSLKCDGFRPILKPELMASESGETNNEMLFGGAETIESASDGEMWRQRNLNAFRPEIVPTFPLDDLLL
jgi:hypothetical protein